MSIRAYAAYTASAHFTKSAFAREPGLPKHETHDACVVCKRRRQVARKSASERSTSSSEWVNSPKCEAMTLSTYLVVSSFSLDSKYWSDASSFDGSDAE